VTRRLETKIHIDQSSERLQQDELNDVRACLQKRHKQLGELIGVGSFANVYRGTYLPPNKPIAIKVIDVKKASQHYQQDLLPQELGLVKKLKHKNTGCGERF